MWNHRAIKRGPHLVQFPFTHEKNMTSKPQPKKQQFPRPAKQILTIPATPGEDHDEFIWVTGFGSFCWKIWKSPPFPGHEPSQNPIILGMGQNHPKILVDIHPQKRWWLYAIIGVNPFWSILVPCWAVFWCSRCKLSSFQPKFCQEKSGLNQSGRHDVQWNFHPKHRLFP